LLMLYLLEQSVRWMFEHGSTLIALPKKWVDISNLTTACWIIIAAFTARRADEILDLREGCLLGDESTGWWLHVYINKTLQRKEWIPIPFLVVKAVETMSLISAKARLETKTDSLFQWKGSNGKVVRLDGTSRLDKFASLVEVPPHKN